MCTSPGPSPTATGRSVTVKNHRRPPLIRGLWSSWLGYRLYKAGISGSNPLKPTFLLRLDLVSFQVQASGRFSPSVI